MTLLFDAPTGYSESPHPDLGGLYCDQCPDRRDVTTEPCPIHGPAATIDRRIDHPRLAQLAELVIRLRDIDTDHNARPVISNTLLTSIRLAGLNLTHLPLLEEWGVIGRTERGIRVAVIHEAHLAIVKAQITEQHGDPTSGTLSYLVMPAFTAKFRKIIELTAQGTENAPIGRHLQLATETVKTYLRRILRQLNAANRTHMIHLAHQRGLFGAIPTPVSS